MTEPITVPVGHKHTFVAAEDELLTSATSDFGVDGLGKSQSNVDRW